MIRRLFNDHPASVGESYGEHMAAAGGFGLRLVLAGLACLVHAVLPFLFERTASDAVRALYRHMAARAAARSGAASVPASPEWFAGSAI
ncbi:MAG TPA: DUF6356 family protein [Azospirillaceae bacterium]|nr:DUF6356 family protein [Azospirillaceae bacterium]